MNSPIGYGKPEFYWDCSGALCAIAAKKRAEHRNPLKRRPHPMANTVRRPYSLCGAKPATIFITDLRAFASFAPRKETSMLYRAWQTKPADPSAEQTLRAAGYGPLLSRVLAARGVQDPPPAAPLLGGRGGLTPPLLMRGMDKAARRPPPAPPESPRRPSPPAGRRGGRGRRTAPR